MTLGGVSRTTCAITFFFTFVLGQVNANQRSRYDGKWWMVRASSERRGFVLGYADCYVDTLGHHDLKFIEASKLDVAITRHYRAVPSSGKALIGEVMKLVLRQHQGDRPEPRAPDGEVWPEKHGYFDGMYWDKKDPEVIGFINGELACFNEEVGSTKRFSRSPDYYIAQIDDLYASGKVGTKIPDMLLLSADKPPGKSARTGTDRGLHP